MRQLKRSREATHAGILHARDQLMNDVHFQFMGTNAVMAVSISGSVYCLQPSCFSRHPLMWTTSDTPYTRQRARSGTDPEVVQRVQIQPIRRA